MENIWDCQDNGECDMQSIKSEENDCWVLVYMQNHKPLNTHTHTHTTWDLSSKELGSISNLSYCA